MELGICTVLSCNTTTTVDLPIKSWEEVKKWYVKWDILHYSLDGEQWHEAELNSDGTDAIDWKRPLTVTVYDPETYAAIAEYAE